MLAEATLLVVEEDFTETLAEWATLLVVEEDFTETLAEVTLLVVMV